MFIDFLYALKRYSEEITFWWMVGRWW